MRIALVAAAFCLAGLNVPLNGGELQQPPSGAKTLTQLKESGEEKIQEKRLGEALTIFKEVVARDQHDVGAMVRLADLYSWTGDYDHSIVLYRDIIAKDTVNLAGLKGLARVLRWAARFTDAEVLYERVLQIEPEDIDALSGLAVMHARQRKLDTALRYIEKAICYAPDNAGNIIIKGDILTWSNRFPEAERSYLAALDMNPGSIEAYRSLGDLYKWSGKYVKSIEAFKHAHKLDPRNSDHLMDLADVALTAGMMGEAEDAVRTMFVLSPDDPRAYKLLRELEARNRIDYVQILQDYVKPCSLILSIVGISLYFHRRREILERRHPYYWRFAYQILPALIILSIAVFVISKHGGVWDAAIIEEFAEFLTFLFLVGAFISLVWVSRGQERSKSRNVLAVGAHPDDIELGCGGTLSKFKEMGCKVYGLVVTGGEEGNPYSNENIHRAKEAEKGASVLGLDRLWVYSFKDTALASQLVEIKDVIEEKIRETHADLIITQSPHDLHQDHSTVFEATRIAARGDKTLLCYEDVSTESHFAANFFVDVTDYMDDKIVAIQSHRTQRHKRYMDPENIRGRAAHRGLQAGLRYAEAFLLYKGVDTWTS